MNLFKLINENLEIQEKTKTNYSIEATKVMNRAKDLFLKSQITPTGQIQFRADDVTEDEPQWTHNGPIYSNAEKKVYHNAKFTANIPNMLGIRILEGCKANFDFPIWNQTVESSDDIQKLSLLYPTTQSDKDQHASNIGPNFEAGSPYPYYIYLDDGTINKVDTNSVTAKDGCLHFKSKKYYVRNIYSDELVRYSESSIQNAIQEDAINEIYNTALLNCLVSDSMFALTGSTLTPYTTTDQILQMIQQSGVGENGILKGTFILSSKAFYTIQKLTHNNENVVKDNLLFGRYEFIISDLLPRHTEGSFLFFNPNDVIMAQFGAFDVTADNVTRRLSGEIKLYIDAYFDAHSKSPIVFGLIQEPTPEPTDDTEPTDEPTDNTEPTTEPTAGEGE